jgi:hypothetical protein
MRLKVRRARRPPAPGFRFKVIWRIERVGVAFSGADAAVAMISAEDIGPRFPIFGFLFCLARGSSQN